MHMKNRREAHCQKESEQCDTRSGLGMSENMCAFLL